MLRSSVAATAVLCAVLLCAQPASAQMFSLWADEQTCSCCVNFEAPYIPFDVYVFFHPGPEGAIGIEYKLVAPVSHINMTNTPAPFIEVMLGEWVGSPGVGAAFSACQYGIVWVCHATMLATDLNGAYYLLEENDDTGSLGIAACTTPETVEQAPLYNYFDYNAGGFWCGPGPLCPNANEESSWGSIKTQYEE